MILKSTHIVIPSKRSLKSYAGVDIETYKILYKELEIIELERHTTLMNKPNRLRQYGSGGKECLLTIDDKLLFILNYFKTYPTMDVMSVKYTAILALKRIVYDKKKRVNKIKKTIIFVQKV
jgi:hypothetical protein